MTKDKIISGLKMTMELFLFDPSTGETCEPDDLNELNRTTYDACKGAVELLEKFEPHWIPVTENCDCDLMDDEEVLVFQKDGTINGQIRHAMFYDFNGKKKFVTWEEGITIYNVLAYMPLPEPYKGVTE